MIKQIQLLAGILFLAILAYAGIWYTVAFQAEKDVAALLSSWRNQGLKVEHGKIEHGGFPYRITVGVKNLSVGTRASGLRVDTKNLQLISHVWTPQHWLVEASGLVATAAKGSTQITSNTLIASYRVHDDGTTLVAFDNTATQGFSIIKLFGMDTVTPEKWQFFLRFGEDANKTQSGLYSARSLSFKVTSSNEGLSLDMIGGISGPTIRDWSKEYLINWSFEGGLLEVDSAVLTAKDSQLKGNASLTLDDNFMPLGSASLNLTGNATISSILEAMGLQTITPLHTQNGPISVMLQNGELSVNGVTALKLKPVID